MFRRSTPKPPDTVTDPLPPSGSRRGLSAARAATLGILGTVGVMALPPVAPLPTGPIAVVGEIGAYYRAHAAVREELGGATDLEVCGHPDDGCVQTFERGRMYWSPASGAVNVRAGGISQAYLDAGGPDSTLGYPIGPVEPAVPGAGTWSMPTRDDHTGQTFRLQWSDAAGAVPVHVSGAIGGTWDQDPARYGAPQSPERCGASGACEQSFEHATLLWSAETGIHLVDGVFRTDHAESGGVDGPWGAASDEQAPLAGGGAAQHFWNPRSDARTVLVHAPGAPHTVPMLEGGPVHERWLADGAERGALGFPTASEATDLVRGGSAQEFESGRIAWSPDTGAWPIPAGPILAAWDEAEGVNGAWGYPASASSTAGKGRQQTFENGLATAGADGSVRFVTFRLAELDEAAVAMSLGAPEGTPWLLSDGSQARRYAQGIVVLTEARGAVAMASQVYDLWSTQRAAHGLPVSAALHGQTISTRFEKDSLGFDHGQQEVVQTDITLGADSVLTIGDSQVYDTSWVGRGLSMSGLEPVFFHMGGIGYANAAGNPYGSYHDGVVEDRWILPQGSPGYIFIGGSGNDTYLSDDARVRREAHEVIRELHRRYPEARIIVGGVLSSDGPAAARRWAMDDLLGQVAREEGVTFMSMKGWISRYGTESYLVDGLHFSDAGQERMAPAFRDNFQRVTGR